MTRAAAALLMMMMMMMTALAAAAPPDRSRGGGVTSHPLPDDGQSNATRAGLLEKLNVTLETRVLMSNDSGNVSMVTPVQFLLPPAPPIGGSRRHCPLPTCATTNLVSDMQGGDEKAGTATSDPYGIGKK